MVFGHIPIGGPASIVQTAATINERASNVKPDDITDEVADGQGQNVTGTDVPGRCYWRVCATYCHSSIGGSFFDTGPCWNEDKVKPSHVVHGARDKLLVDKVAASEDAESVASADPNLASKPGGVVVPAADNTSINTRWN